MFLNGVYITVCTSNQDPHMITCEERKLWKKDGCWDPSLQDSRMPFFSNLGEPNLCETRCCQEKIWCFFEGYTVIEHPKGFYIHHLFEIRNPFSGDLELICMSPPTHFHQKMIRTWSTFTSEGHSHRTRQSFCKSPALLQTDSSVKDIAREPGPKHPQSSCSFKSYGGVNTRKTHRKNPSMTINNTSSLNSGKGLTFPSTDVKNGQDFSKRCPFRKGPLDSKDQGVCLGICWDLQESLLG